MRFFLNFHWAYFQPVASLRYCHEPLDMSRPKKRCYWVRRSAQNDALKMGIAWKVVSRSIVHETAQEAAKQIAALPQQTIADFKRVSNQINLSDFEQLLSLEKESALRAMLNPITRRRVRESRSQ